MNKNIDSMSIKNRIHKIKDPFCSMSHDKMVNEFQEALKVKQFTTVSERLEHEYYVALLHVRLMNYIKPKFDVMITAITHKGVIFVAPRTLDHFKFAMMTLTSREFNDLWYVFEVRGVEIVINILSAEYPCVATPGLY